MKAIRIGICLLVAFAVLAFGAIEPWAYAILAIGAAVLLVLWSIRAMRQGHAELQGNWLYLPLVGWGLLGIAQYAFGFSVYPYLTKLDLLKGGAYLLLGFLAVESFRDTAGRKQLVWFLLSFGFAVSLFGIVQHFTFNGKLYWTRLLAAGGSPFGPYVNRNDFAGFVELVAPLGLAVLFFRAARREHFTFALLFTLVPIGAAILSASRGGILVLAFDLLLLAFLARARRMGGKQFAGVAALALLAGAFVVWLGVTAAIQRFEQLTPSEISKDRRVAIYGDTWRIFVDHPLAGTGLGTLIAVYPRYASFYNPGTVVDHAHNDYLELLADTGVAGGLCGLAFIVLLFRYALQNLQAAEGRFDRAFVAGSLTSCAGLLLHSLVDFNLQIPANALIFLVLAFLAATGPLGPSEARLGVISPSERSASAVWRVAPRQDSERPVPVARTL